MIKQNGIECWQTTKNVKGGRILKSYTSCKETNMVQSSWPASNSRLFL